MVCGLSGCGSQALEHRLKGCGTQARLICGTWDLPRRSIHPVSPALAGRFFTTEPPGKPPICNFKSWNILNFDEVRRSRHGTGVWRLGLCLNPDFPGGSDGKESACSARFDPWFGKIPGRRKWQSTPVLLPGKFHGQRSLAGYCPWGRKESDMTEWLHFLFCVLTKWLQACLSLSFLICNMVIILQYFL